MKLIEFNFPFILCKTNLTNYLEKIYSTKEDQGTLDINENEKLSFEKLEDKIKIKYNGEEGFVDKEPILFLNENKELIFKIYDKSNQNAIKEFLTTIYYDYNFYGKNNNIIKKEELLEKNEKTIILKLKNEEFENLFKPLFNKINITNESEVINTNILLPIQSSSLGFLFNFNFHLIIKQRMPLIEKIYGCLKNDNISVIKIYGCDGIGKSISYLFFTTLNDGYKKVYFNLKDIYKYPSDKKRLFY